MKCLTRFRNVNNLNYLFISTLVVTAYFIVVLYKRRFPSSAETSHIQQANNHSSGKLESIMENSLKVVDLLKQEIPDLKSTADSVKIEEKRVDISGYNMFLREALPPQGIPSSGLTCILLHGMMFKSQTWLDLGTIGLLAAMGHRVIAVDLPGFGETSGESVPEDKKSSYLSTLMDVMSISNPVIVSPSMSGSFALPFLFSNPSKLSGYIPVAPVLTDNFTAEQYNSIKVPTLIIVGELDTLLGDVSTKNLKSFANHQLHVLPGAKHPAYLDQPELFHKLLYNFLKWLHLK